MARVLIVEPAPSVDAVAAALAAYGHTVTRVSAGDLARGAVVASDLVVIDAARPPGPEVAEAVRHGRVGHPVPSIVVVGDAASRARMIDNGAWLDEVVDPAVDPRELLIRIDGLLALRAHRTQLANADVTLAELRRFQGDVQAVLRHDIKGPLTVIMANLDYLRGDLAVEGESRVAVEDSITAGRRALRLISSMVETVGLEAGRLAMHQAATSLAPLVDDVLAARAGAVLRRGLRLERAVDAGAIVMVDRDLVLRVLEKLADNAVRHCPDGGTIRVWSKVAGAACELRFGNSGAAVPTESRHAVFEKDAVADDQENAEGGLYFCRLVAEAHDGRIWVEEGPELPAVFALALPAATTTSPPSWSSSTG